MSQPSDLERVTTEYRQALLSREAEAAKAMAASYEAARAQIRQAIDDLAKAMESYTGAANQIPRSWFTEQDRLSKLLRLVEEGVNGWSSYAQSTISLALADAAAMGGEVALAQLRSVIPAPIGGGFGIPSLDAMEQSAGSMRPGSPLNALFAAMGQNVAGQIADGLFTGLAMGLNPRQVGRQLKEIADLPVRRGALIARTEMLRSYRNAAVGTYRNNTDVVKGWRWRAAWSLRTCIACLAMDGKEFPLSRPFGSHPACRCVPIPLLRKNVSDYLKNAGLSQEELYVFDKVQGTTGSTSDLFNTAYYWFRSLPEAQKLQVLGTTRYAWFVQRAGMISASTFFESLAKVTRDRQWGRGLRIATLDELGIPRNFAATVRLPNPADMPQPWPQPQKAKPRYSSEKVVINNRTYLFQYQGTKQEFFARLKAFFQRDITYDDLIRITTDDPDTTIIIKESFKDLAVSAISRNVVIDFVIRRDANGNLIHKDSSVLNFGQKSAISGIKVIEQFAHLKRLGFDRLEASAGRREYNPKRPKEQPMNGYWTWAQLGFVGDIPSQVLPAVQRVFGPTVTRVEQLMRTKEGRIWWKKNGITWDATFDFNENSYSWNVFQSFVTRLAARAARHANPGEPMGGPLPPGGGFSLGVGMAPILNKIRTFFVANPWLLTLLNITALDVGALGDLPELPLPYLRTNQKLPKEVITTMREFMDRWQLFTYDLPTGEGFTGKIYQDMLNEQKRFDFLVEGRRIGGWAVVAQRELAYLKKFLNEAGYMSYAYAFGKSGNNNPQNKTTKKYYKEYWDNLAWGNLRGKKDITAYQKRLKSASEGFVRQLENDDIVAMQATIYALRQNFANRDPQVITNEQYFQAVMKQYNTWTAKLIKDGIATKDQVVKASVLPKDLEKAYKRLTPASQKALTKFIQDTVETNVVVEENLPVFDTYRAAHQRGTPQLRQEIESRRAAAQQALEEFRRIPVNKRIAQLLPNIETLEYAVLEAESELDWLNGGSGALVNATDVQMRNLARALGVPIARKEDIGLLFGARRGFRVTVEGSGWRDIKVVVATPYPPTVAPDAIYHSNTITAFQFDIQNYTGQPQVSFSILNRTFANTITAFNTSALVAGRAIQFLKETPVPFIKIRFPQSLRVEAAMFLGVPNMNVFPSSYGGDEVLVSFATQSDPITSRFLNVAQRIPDKSQPIVIDPPSVRQSSQRSLRRSQLIGVQQSASTLLDGGNLDTTAQVKKQQVVEKLTKRLSKNDDLIIASKLLAQKLISLNPDMGREYRRVYDQFVKAEASGQVDDATRYLFVSNTVNMLIKSWSVGGKNPVIQTLQIAAEQEFGLKDVVSVVTPAARKKYLEEYGAAIPGFRAFMRAMYNETQSWFRKNGITEIPLYRGMSFTNRGKPDFPYDNQVREAALKLLPVSSFTSNAATAVQFAGTWNMLNFTPTHAVLFGAVVPVRRILAIPLTGFGSSGEFEFTVLGGDTLPGFLRSVALADHTFRNDDAYDTLDESVALAVVAAPLTQKKTKRSTTKKTKKSTDEEETP
jgi:molecular chaperone GrpE (heat shock protein)